MNAPFAIAASGPAAIARSNAIAAWATDEITRQRGPRPAIVRMRAVAPATAEQRREYVDAFAAEFATRDAQKAWDVAYFALIRASEAGRAA
ncbi:MAG: hypothetical protein P0Y64_16660 [Candidatus Sphingomonas colombiensis]|nr:hypothetical protein [Sphingomonas sp.]WEK42951.1 MAG: hypothetical protein P0Y64_16660 [Sphingomonas sp.]